MNKIKLATLTIFSLFLFYGCSDDPVKSEGEFDVSFVVSPDIGGSATEFRIISIEIDGIPFDSLTGYVFKIDWNGDGKFDTDWMDTPGTGHIYNQEGRYEIKIEVKNEGGEIVDEERIVYAVELIPLLENEPDRISMQNIDWSRDGTDRIVFEWYTPDNPMIHSLWVFDYPDGDPKLILSGEENEYLTFPEWSPDGGGIAFSGSDHGLGIYNIQEDTIYYFGAYCDFWCRWSPDGTWILFPGKLFSSSDHATYLWNVENNTYRTLFDENVLGACWSPDGKYIAVTYDRSRLLILDHETEAVIREFDDISNDMFGTKFDWSPDGRWISLGFYLNVESGENALHLLNYETGEILRVHFDELRRCWYPSWSGDGSIIAFEGCISGESKSSIWGFYFPEDL